MGSWCRSLSFFYAGFWFMSWKEVCWLHTFHFLLAWLCKVPVPSMQQMHLVCYLEEENLHHQVPLWVLLNPRWCLTLSLVFLLHPLLHSCGVCEQAVSRTTKTTLCLLHPSQVAFLLFKCFVFMLKGTKATHLFNCCLRTVIVHRHIMFLFTISWLTCYFLPKLSCFFQGRFLRYCHLFWRILEEHCHTDMLFCVYVCVCTRVKCLTVF